MQDGPGRAHGGSCLWQDSIRETVLGKCSKGGILTQCATDVGACPEESGWEGLEPECTVETTSFGRCEYGMCAWSHEHCTASDSSWVAFDESCTCDQVQVGGCSRLKGDGEKEIFCAVSKDACDDEQSWIKAQDVNNAVGFDCFLCRELSSATAVANDVGVPSTADIAAINTDVNTDPIAAINTDVNTDPSSSGVQTVGNTTIIVSSILGAVLALVIISLIVWSVFSTRRATKRAVESGFEKEEAPPAITIEVNNSGNDDNHGPDSTTDMDNASVLSDDV